MLLKLAFGTAVTNGPLGMLIGRTEPGHGHVQGHT